MKEFKIEILNPEEVKILFERWGRFAAKCYDTPLKFAERVLQTPCQRKITFAKSGQIKK